VRHASVAHAARDAEDRRTEVDLALAGAVALQVQLDELVVASGKFALKQIIVAAPLNPRGRRRPACGEIARLSAGHGDDPYIAAGRALVAHQAADKGDGLAIGRPPRHRNLQPVQRAPHRLRRQNRLPVTRPQPCAVPILGVKLRHPPVVLSRRLGSDIGEPLRIGPPVKLINVQVSRCEKTVKSRRVPCGGPIRLWFRGASVVPVARNLCERHALHFDVVFAHDARPRLHGGQRTRRTGGALHIKEGHLRTVRREGRFMHIALQCRQLLRGIAIHARQI
jgi:hypothetical protein